MGTSRWVAATIGVDGQDPQRRWGVHDNVFVILQERRQRVLELEGCVELTGELLLEFGERQAPGSHNSKGSLDGLIIAAISAR